MELRFSIRPRNPSRRRHFACAANFGKTARTAPAFVLARSFGESVGRSLRERDGSVGLSLRKRQYVRATPACRRSSMTAPVQGRRRRTPVCQSYLFIITLNPIAFDSPKPAARIFLSAAQLRAPTNPLPSVVAGLPNSLWPVSRPSHGAMLCAGLPTPHATDRRSPREVI